MTRSNAATRMDATRIPDSPSCYCAAPPLDQLLLGVAVLAFGQRGDAVSALQGVLQALGFQLALDGCFGPRTQDAVRSFARDAGLPDDVSGVDLALWTMMQRARSGPALRDDFLRRGASSGAARRAPRFGARAPAGSISAGALQQADDQRLRSSRAARSGPTVSPSLGSAPPIRAASGQTRADAELSSIQARTMASARQEIGVREIGSSNRGDRVDQYARRSGMRVGGAWCGYFTGFNYSEAARASGGEFTGINGFHSMQKARSFFEYRSYTDNSRATNEGLDRLREQHAANGSTRRWMTLAGSGGARHAAARQRPHEVFEPSTLPIRAGDTALFSHGHVGLVEGYDPTTGRLTTIEGNTSQQVRRREYDLNDPADRAKFEGFGRPARDDFTASTAP